MDSLHCNITISAVGLKDTDLATAKVLKGTCTDMCPEKERYLREVRRLLHPYEFSANYVPQVRARNKKCLEASSNESENIKTVMLHK